MTPRRPGLTLIELLVIIAVIAILLGLLIPAVQASREAARRTQCVGHLKMIVIGVHNYHEVYGSFPPGRLNRRVDGAGTCWSATALILPYIVQPELFNELNFTLAPDRETANTTALGTHLATLNCPSDFAPGPGTDRLVAHPPAPANGPQGGITYGTTNYLFGTGSNQAVVAQPGATPTDQPNGIFFENSAIRLTDVIDGTATTTMMIETTRSVAGTRFADEPLGGLVLTGNDRSTGPPLRSNADYVLRCTSRRPALFLPERGSQWGFGAPGATLGNQTRPPNDPGPDCRGGLAASHQTAQGWDDLSHDIAARSYHRGGVNVARVDGYITFVSNTISPQVWRAMATRAYGEIWTSCPY